MVGTNASIKGGRSATITVETAEETVKTSISDNTVSYVSNGKETSNGIFGSNGRTTKIVPHINGAANGSAVKSVSLTNEAANGSTAKTLVHTNGAANGSAAKTLVHANGTANGSAAKTLVHTNGAANGHATKTVVHQYGSSTNAVEQRREGPTTAGFKTEESVIHANGANGVGHAHKIEKSQTTGEQKKSGRHAGVGHKTILQSEALNQYILETTVYPREHEQLRELRLMTAKHRWNLMLSPADEGQFLQVLLKLMNAKNTIEIGTYTGYSLLATALALPADGKIVAMDLNRDCLNLGWPYIEKAGVANKITFVGGPALDSLDELIKDEKNHSFFDFVFVDADKDNYMNYHERLLTLVKVGGVIGYDNTLWNGTVVASAEDLESMPKYIRFYQPFIDELNRFLGRDPRVEPTLVSIGDGVTLCRKVI